MSLRALSFDGGGIRGVFPAQFMAAVQGLNLVDACQIIAGTSTGAIIAGSLAIGKTPDAILDLYKTLGPNVFKSKRGFFARHCYGKTTYCSKNLRELLRKHIDDGITLGDLKKRILIPATRLNNCSLQVFDSENKHHQQYRLVDVILASTAAPTYFSPHKLPSDGSFWLDGGLVCNNPAFECVLAFLRCEYATTQKIKILSIGNGTQPNTPDPIRFTHKKPIAWGVSLISMCMDLSSEHAHQQCAAMLTGENYRRISHTLEEKIALDDWEKALRLLPPLATLAAQSYYASLQEWLKPDAL